MTIDRILTPIVAPDLLPEAESPLTAGEVEP